MKKAICILLIFACFFLTACDKEEERGKIPIIGGDAEAWIDASALSKETNLATVLAVAPQEEVLLYTEEGAVLRAKAGAYFLSSKGEIRNNEGRYGSLLGVIENPPTAMITDVADIAFAALNAGEKVLILYLDGFGYDSYVEALGEGILPNLSQLAAQKAATVYPSITPVTYSAMVSGETPDLTGVQSRDDHMLACETVFDKAIAMGKTTQIVEGGLQIIVLAGEVSFNSDGNGDGSTDDEVFADAMEKITQDPDLLLVHFHGIDDVSHIYGPHSTEALAAIAENDRMAGELLSLWSGRVIVVADHGQHKVEEDGVTRGEHGEFCASDIFIPLLQN